MVIFGLTVALAVVMLALGTWPGVVEDAVLGFPHLCLAMPLLAGWTLLLLVLSVADLARRPGPRGRRWWGAASCAVWFATAGLLWCASRRVVFGIYHAEFTRLADGALGEDVGGVELGRYVGPYWVDRYGADARGGVFFRTHTGPDGIGPDQMSNGFALRPNSEGTPFGNARYCRCHLFGEWYSFEASDDW